MSCCFPAAYKGDKTPLIVPHVKSAITSKENYADLSTAYAWPNHSKVICPGRYVHDCIHGSYGKVEEVDKTHGELTKITIRNAKTNRKKSVKPANAVVVPPLKAFVQHKKSRFWYQIKSNVGKQVVLRLILSPAIPQPEEPTDLTTEESLESKTHESAYEPAAEPADLTTDNAAANENAEQPAVTNTVNDPAANTVNDPAAENAKEPAAENAKEPAAKPKEPAVTEPNEPAAAAENAKDPAAEKPQEPAAKPKHPAAKAPAAKTAAAVITCPVPATHPHPKATVHPVAVAQFVHVEDAKKVPDVTVSYDSIMARTVIEDPDLHLPPFLDYWVENKPDTSEGRPPNVSELGFWKSLCGLLKAHTDFPGLCAKWLHIAFDFAIAQNQWPVRFQRNGETYDMVVPFIFTAWVCYCAQMNGSPDLTSKACQKVQYTNPPLKTQIRL